MATISSLFKNKWVRRLCLLGGLVAYFALVFWAFPRLGLRCVFLDFLGFPCPGCGMTRAFFSLLRLDIAAAWRYHPLVFAMPYVVAYLFFDLKPARVHRYILAAVGVAALIHWAFVLVQHFS